MSDSPGLVNFAVGQVRSVLPLPDRQVKFSLKFSEEIKITEVLYACKVRVFFSFNRDENLSLFNIKDDFQSVLRTLESLFRIFVLFDVRRYKMLHFTSTYMK